MATLYDRLFDASKTSLEVVNIESDTIYGNIWIKFNCGEHHLDFKFLVLRSDLIMLHTLILNNWDELLEAKVWDSTDPSFSFAILANNSELIGEQIYQFQFWIDAGEFNSHRATRSGIGITIYQARKSIEEFALQIKKEFD
ncbi:hypothetical protein [Lysinibacillus parviboronicapiens]|uniref:hypothetical protein n=1 Tax=Lysinibacillus parviboronicapiens TaxID=436516 RepID=UPI000D34D52A|nr:hypothetical protein [Lysinibacillus parviboronicapiens]